MESCKTALSGYYVCLSRDLLLMPSGTDVHTYTNVHGWNNFKKPGPHAPGLKYTRNNRHKKHHIWITTHKVYQKYKWITEAHCLSCLVRTRTDIKMQPVDTAFPMLFVTSYNELEQLHMQVLLIVIWPLFCAVSLNFKSSHFILATCWDKPILLHSTI